MDTFEEALRRLVDSWSATDREGLVRMATALDAERRLVLVEERRARMAAALAGERELALAGERKFATAAARRLAPATGLRGALARWREWRGRRARARLSGDYRGQ